MNKSLLSAFMTYHGDTQKSLAGKMRISEQWLRTKINGRNAFRERDMLKIRDLYNLSDAEVNAIFFSEEV